MLTDLDDTLQHQTAEPFGHAYTSDHRFFDRNWFGCYDPSGRVGVITGLGAYANMNALDGFAAVQLDGKQYNYRASRPLRPRLGDLEVASLHHETLKPLWIHGLVLQEGAHDASFDLTWTGVAPAHLEAASFGRLDGRVFEDYRRFDQVGTVSGWLRVGEERIDAEGWFGVRDHSWGVRRQVGGFEPFTGGFPRELTDGVLFVWLEFAAEGGTGHVQLYEDGAGRQKSLDGFILPDNGRPLAIDKLEHDIRFIPGRRAYESALLRVTTEDGASWEIEAEPLITAWAYRGTGYDGGFNDNNGLGVYRGEVVEYDIYDVSHPEDVVLPDGSTIQPLHREQGVRLTVNGKAGFGHFPVIPVGRIERYGLGI